MAINLTSTAAAAANKQNFLIHAPAGAGKTTSLATTGEPTVIISAEGGLLSLAHLDMPVIEVQSMQDVRDAFELVSGEQGESFKWIALDSISEIAEVVLAYEKSQTRDARKAYGELQEQMMSLLRAFRDLPGKNVIMTCKQERIKDDTSGSLLYAPMMPGSKLAQNVPYIFDFVFALRVEKDDEGNISRWFQTQPDVQYAAKSRGYALETFEPADFKHIAEKIRGSFNQPKAVNN